MTCTRYGRWSVRFKPAVAIVGIFVGVVLLTAGDGVVARGGKPADSGDGSANYESVGQLLVVSSKNQDWVSVCCENSGEWKTYRAPAGVKIRPVVPVAGGLVAISIEGDTISEVAVFCPGVNQWCRQSLTERWHGRIVPEVGPAIAAYCAGSRIYAIGAKHGAWDVLVTKQPCDELKMDGGFCTLKMGGVMAIFTSGNIRWSLIDLTSGEPLPRLPSETAK
jgi:hypothetical protein